MMNVLGIETSCDDTAIAIVNEKGLILAQTIYNQFKVHQQWGGVVPELAARNHLDKISDALSQTMSEAHLEYDQLDAVSATCGPGLIGGVLVGAAFAKAIAWAKKIPFMAINHLEGHALSVRLEKNIQFPYLLLLVSGGHCMFVIVKKVGDYHILGQTLDDAAGECFDKVARLLDLGWPGGPAVEKAAMNVSNIDIDYNLPRPMCHRKGCDLSFAGLKSAVQRLVGKFDQKALETQRDAIAYAFQEAVCDILSMRASNALKIGFDMCGPIDHFVMAGGVAANHKLRQRMQILCAQHQVRFFAPDPALCTDNGAMIAWAGIEAMQAGRKPDIGFRPTPRWRLDQVNV
ncbi:MAG: tRNA (adenosine(37)-N6)-threonylcarbamoyltransferase complex transferase subunit TsaD [Pseudomonadota bacterium]